MSHNENSSITFLVLVPVPIFKSSGFKKDFGSDSINFDPRPATKNRIKIMDFGKNEFRFFCFIRTWLVINYESETMTHSSRFTEKESVT